MKRIKRVFKSLLSVKILERIIFILVIIAVIIIASGIKYDFNKNEFIQTGVLNIQNIEDNTNISFNKNNYNNRNDLSIRFLEQNVYDLNINKENRKNYSTKVNIKEGEVTFVYPVLIPITLKTTAVSTGIFNVKSSLNSIYYTYKEENKVYLEKLTLNKFIYTVDSTKTRIDITNFLQDPSSPIKLYISDNENNILVSIGPKLLLTDFSKPLIYDISANMPPGSISDIVVRDNHIIAHIDQFLYSIDFKDPLKLQRNLVHNGATFFYNVKNDDTIFLLDTSSSPYVYYTYDFNGVEQSKEVINNLNIDSTKETKIIIVNNNIYLKNGGSIYLLNDKKIFEQYLDNVISYSVVDKNTVVFVTSSETRVVSKDRVLSYVNNLIKPTSISMLLDYFTFFYTDEKNSLHLSDVGGQDNVILENVLSDFISIQNGSDTYVYYATGNEIRFIKFGNKQ